jgi:hypothetical protein
MMRYTRRAALAAIGSALAAAVSAGCASKGGGTPRASRGRQTDLITRDEITRAQWATAYDMVLALRPRWLSTRGADTIMGQQGEVQVRVDDSPAGGIGVLRTLTPSVIASMRFVDPVAAAGRWGSSHMHGAILVSTRTQ